MADMEQALRACKLLIVEDDRINRAILNKILISGGYQNIIFAENGKQGLELTEELRPDLVILDMIMPEMDGFGYCQAVQKNPELAGIPIIIQTGLEKKEDKVRAFSMGACDYITKPIHSLELLARIKVHLSNKLLMEETYVQKEQMHAELRAAELMQKNLMPSPEQVEMAEGLYHLKMAQHFETSSIMGGDFWGMHPLSPTRMGIYITDFSGHGVSAAMNVFRMHTLMQELMAHANDAGNFLTKLNHHIYPLIERNEFATMFYAIIDIEANCLEYAAAASPPALITRAEDGSKEWLECRGFPLGAVPEANYKTIHTPYASGDSLVIFSDCLIETVNERGKVISKDEIAMSVENALRQSPLHVALHIKNMLIGYFQTHNTRPLADDLTVNVYCRK